jgi:single-stranded-DNA-specific exonuclease
LDCGIKSVELISYAKDLGIDFVVCDHHLPDEKLPPAIAILNPKQKECNYPYKELCGCGVGFKLICALTERLNLPAETSFEYLDLLATAIAADIVPMTGENRILAFHGLVKANKNPNHGIKALTKLSSLAGEIHITNLVFMIAPRVMLQAEWMMPEKPCKCLLHLRKKKHSTLPKCYIQITQKERKLIRRLQKKHWQ